MFQAKTLLITGGTGSFGTAMVRRFLNTDIGEIRIFSRDEKKQDDMRRVYRNTRLKYYIGDVRDKSGISDALRGVDFVFHAAALKQVPSCEYFPMEAVKTNIIGTDNVLSACIERGVRKVVCLSTDKAVQPVSAMGISKAMAEKLLLARARTSDTTQICGTRYGNILCSRGSVVPRFIDCIKNGEPLPVTNPSMTRFIMTMEETAELTLHAFQYGKNGDIFVHKASACSIGTLAQAVKEIFHADNPIEIIGIRPGEKMFETLLSAAELSSASHTNNFYCIPADFRTLCQPQTSTQINPQTESFTSDNAKLLTVEEVKEKLLSLPYIQNKL